MFTYLDDGETALLEKLMQDRKKKELEQEVKKSLENARRNHSKARIRLSGTEETLSQRISL